jgi:hypothetical protein
MQNLPTLLIPEKTDVERELIFATWAKRGGIIKRLGRYWVKDEELAKQPLAIYGSQTFALVLAQIYDVNLISPDDSLIARLDKKWTKRSVQLKKMSELNSSNFPAFIKPLIPKLFQAGIFQTLSDFSKITEGLADSEEVLISNIIDITAEARCFEMNGIVNDVAIYEGSADLESAGKFLSEFLDENKNKLPKVVVIDLAFNDELGWFVLEFNSCWGAGLNNCIAEKVIDCIISATETSARQPHSR